MSPVRGSCCPPVTSTTRWAGTAPHPRPAGVDKLIQILVFGCGYRLRLAVLATAELLSRHRDPDMLLKQPRSPTVTGCAA